MNVDLQRHAVRSAFRCGRELQDLLLLLKQYASADEYASLRIGIADAMAAIASGITDRVIASNPEIRSEIEDQMKTYGSFL